MRPEFGCGIHDFVFDAIDAVRSGASSEIRDALDRWEPRIEVRRRLRPRRASAASCRSS